MLCTLSPTLPSPSLHSTTHLGMKIPCVYVEWVLTYSIGKIVVMMVIMLKPAEPRIGKIVIGVIVMMIRIMINPAKPIIL